MKWVIGLLLLCLILFVFALAALTILVLLDLQDEWAVKAMLTVAMIVGLREGISIIKKWGIVLD